MSDRLRLVEFVNGGAWRSRTAIPGMDAEVSSLSGLEEHLPPLVGECFQRLLAFQMNRERFAFTRGYNRS